MTWIKTIAIFQAISFVALAALFVKQHSWRLAIAQICYVVLTIVIFIR